MHLRIEFEVAKGKKIKVGMQAKSGYRRKTDGAHSGGEMEIVSRLLQDNLGRSEVEIAKKGQGIQHFYYQQASMF